MKKLILATAVLATALATPASADPKHGRSHDRYERHDRYDRNDRHDRYDRYDDRGRGNNGNGVGRYGVPPGHLPRAGTCRVWFEGRPPGHQPAATSCRQAERVAHRYGGRVIYGGRR
ncbi:hypothetical protein V5740_07750 [Croceibacterium sp. TMG7-5b_MA50]|uniref:hypothetical protein n=1 Tax=Croceibacterium sp. TMG7-5b_MA50 TaxID=3121290 RepID=UPI0032216F66